MNYWVSGGFSVLATAADLYAIPNILHAKKELSDAEILALDPTVLAKIDRWALRQNPAKRDRHYSASDVFLPGSMIAGGLLALDKRVRRHWAPILLMYYETHAVAFSLYNFSPFGPAFQNRVRPNAYYSEVPMNERKRSGNRNSMFSGHTASATAAFYFIAKVYTDYHPELGNKKYWFFVVATLPPLVQGYLRMKALAHFPSDIFAGMSLGAVTGIAIPALHRIRNKNINAGMVATPLGPQMGLTLRLAGKAERHTPLPDFRPTVAAK